MAIRNARNCSLIAHPTTAKAGRNIYRPLMTIYRSSASDSIATLSTMNGKKVVRRVYARTWNKNQVKANEEMNLSKQKYLTNIKYRSQLVTAIEIIWRALKERLAVHKKCFERRAAQKGPNGR